MPRFVVELTVIVEDPAAGLEDVKTLYGHVHLEIEEQEEDRDVWGLCAVGIKVGEEWVISWRSQQPDLLTAVTRGIGHARKACRKRGITTLRILGVFGREESDGS